MDLPDKVSKKDYGDMSEILEAVKKSQTPKQIEQFYEKYVVKIQKSAKKEANGNVIEDPAKYACANIRFCLDNLDVPDKYIIVDNWKMAIPGLAEAYLNDV